MNKIFGIGLPKSGTTSLHEALITLGYRSKHNPDDLATEKELRSANYNLTILKKYDALTDSPIPAIFAQLNEAWPGSKFILTLRPIDAWIESCRRAPFNQDWAISKPGSTIEFYRTLIYGCNAFDENRFRWVYETHSKLVYDYFSGSKADQLLILDFEKGAGWSELCTFLGKPIPDAPFPHANRIIAKKELTPIQQFAVRMLIRVGFDYRWLREVGNKIRYKGKPP